VLIEKDDSSRHKQSRSLKDFLKYLSERFGHGLDDHRQSSQHFPRNSVAQENFSHSHRDSFAKKLALSAQVNSKGSSAHYACSHYIRKAFDRVDPSLDRLFAGQARDDHFGDDPRFKTLVDDKKDLNLRELEPGDTIVYGPRIGTDDAGHVETMGLDHLMHSDFTHKLTMNFVNQYQWLTVYRPDNA
jgi:hypothetical protein